MLYHQDYRQFSEDFSSVLPPTLLTGLGVGFLTSGAAAGRMERIIQLSTVLVRET